MQQTSKQINGSAKAGQPTNGDDALKRVRAATAMLEALAADESMLAGISIEERARLLRAAGQVYCPDVRIRRQFIKNRERQHRAER